MYLHKDIHIYYLKRGTEVSDLLEVFSTTEGEKSHNTYILNKSNHICMLNI